MRICKSHNLLKIYSTLAGLDVFCPVGLYMWSGFFYSWGDQVLWLYVWLVFCLIICVIRFSYFMCDQVAASIWYKVFWLYMWSGFRTLCVIRFSVYICDQVFLLYVWSGLLTMCIIRLSDYTWGFLTICVIRLVMCDQVC